MGPDLWVGPGLIGVSGPDVSAGDGSEALARNGVEHGVLGATHGDVDQ